MGFPWPIGHSLWEKVPRYGISLNRKGKADGKQNDLSGCKKIATWVSSTSPCPMELKHDKIGFSS